MAQQAGIPKLLKDSVNLFLELINDLILFFFKPSKFFQRAKQQKRNTLIRKIVYSFLLIEFLLICVVASLRDSVNVNTQTVVAYTVIDMLIALPLVLLFYFIFKLTKVSSPLKTAAAYILYTKIFLTGFPIVFAALFLDTELYFFAVLRAATYYGMLLYIIVGVALIFADRLKRALAIFGLSVLLSCTYFLTLGIIMHETASPKIIEKLNVLGDPIFDEYWEHHNITDFLLKENIAGPYFEVVDSLTTLSKFDYALLWKFRKSWVSKETEILGSVTKAESDLENQHLRFSTNKEIYGLFSTYLLELKKLCDDYRSLYFSSSIEEGYNIKLNKVADQLLVAQESRIVFIERSTAYINLANKLRAWHIIL